MRLKPIDLIFAAALIAGIFYFERDRLGVTVLWSPVLKGACVALLSSWAALQARTLDAWLIAAALALGAVGDVLLETHGLIAGAIAFLGGHLVASWLYWRNREGRLALIPAVTLATAIGAWCLASAPGIAVYASVLGLMAGTALSSRFASTGAGLGAILFVASDLLIFAKQGPLSASPFPELLIWPLYVTGQAAIAWSLVTTLRTDAHLKRELVRAELFRTS